MCSGSVQKHLNSPTRPRRLRERYITRFVDTSTAYFRNAIDGRGALGDETHYSGYLWDTLKHAEVITQQQLIDALTAWQQVYVLWDLHSERKILIPDYWKFPKDSVLRSTSTNLARVLLHDADVGPTADLILPEDLYLFGDTVESNLITTHEYVPERYCLRAD
jgi:hypothetical protein